MAMTLNDSVLKNTYKNQVSDTLRIDYIVNKTTAGVTTDAVATMVKITTADGATSESRIGSGSLDVANHRMFFGFEGYTGSTSAERSTLLAAMLADFESLIA